MLFEFQTLTINTIIEKMKTENILLLVGEKDSGKSMLAKEIEPYLVDTHTLFFGGNPSLKYTDFGCFPKSFLDNYNNETSKKHYADSIKKDIAATLANVIFLSVENTLDSFLSSNEKSEISDMIYYISNLATKKKICLIFDNIEYYDRKSMFFLYNILSWIINESISNVQVLAILDQSRNSKQTILDMNLVEQLPQVFLHTLTDNDLATFLSKDCYAVGRDVPIKYLLNLKDNCVDLTKYYKEKLDVLSENNVVIRRILYTLVLLDEEVSFTNLTVFLYDLQATELFQNIELLKTNSFIEWHAIGNNVFYTVPELIKKAIRQDIPLYLSINRFEIFARQIEQYASLDYVLKYWLYNKAGNMDNAYANAILAYCSIARGESYCTNLELENFDMFLNNSSYREFYMVLRKSYRLFNTNEYKKSFTLIDKYLKENQFISKSSIFFSVYIPEFIFEMIFLRGMCIGRVPNCDEDIICNQVSLLDSLIAIAQLTLLNNELILRLREQRLLLKTYISIQSRKEQRDIYNEYFAICNQYQAFIRQSTLGTRDKWDIRYASFLLKANIVTGIPDKLHILEKGYEILMRKRNTYPDKYLRAVCNLAGDYMWRNQFEHSLQILEDAVNLIEEKNSLQYWGVIYQMYIFSRLYGNTSDTPQILLKEYNQKIWKIAHVKNKMHEMTICNSNYAILLAATGKFEEAFEILHNTISNQKITWNHYNEYLLSTNLGMIKYILGDISGAIELELHCKKLIEQNLVPIFSPVFIKKRTRMLLDIYHSKNTVDNVLLPLKAHQTLSTGYSSDNYLRPLLFSDINYWCD